ncbi:hypothetical protein ABBQ32_007686 [Trebouxia sp. C0010 RCD-2024]
MAQCRFNAALKTLKVNDEDYLWVKLGQCNLKDGKARQVSEALQKNKFLTSLDLSGNRITDGGAEALAAALSDGAVPDLIYLDMRGNLLTEAGITLLAGLTKLRKQLTVETGPSPAELAAQKAESASAGESATNTLLEEAAGENEVVQRWGQDDGGGKQAMVREPSLPPELEEDPQAAATQLWQEVCEALGADPVDLPVLAEALRYIGIGLTKEVEDIRQEACHSLPIALKATTFKPFYDSSFQRLSDLSAAVDHRGPLRLTTYDRDQRQEAGGGHLPGAATILARLVACGQLEAESQIVASQFVPRLVGACLQYPCANPLHCATFQLIRACVDSSCPELLLPLVSAQPQTDGHSDTKQMQLPLHRQLMAIGTGSQEGPVGKRPCHLAFVIQLSQLLRQVQDGFSGDHQQLADALKDPAQKSQRPSCRLRARARGCLEEGPCLVPSNLLGFCRALARAVAQDLHEQIFQCFAPSKVRLVVCLHFKPPAVIQQHVSFLALFV